MEFALKVGFGFLAYQVLRLVGVPLEFFLILAIAIAIGWPLGWFVGTLIGDGTDVDTPMFKAIAWINLVAWVIPFAGVAVAKLTSSIGKGSIRSPFFYDAMSMAGYVLVVFGGATNYYLLTSEFSDQEQPAIAFEQNETDPFLTGERKFARCPYAAIEQWSEDEVQEHCNREPTIEELQAFEEEMKRYEASRG